MPTAFSHEVAAVRWYLDQRVIRETGAEGVCPRSPVLLAPVLAASIAARMDAPRRRGPPPAAFPSALERRYRSQLQRRTRQVTAFAEQALEAEIRRRAPDIDERARRDTAASDTRGLIRVVDMIERAVRTSTPIPTEMLERLGAQVDRFTQGAVTEQIRTVIGIDVLTTRAVTSSLLEAWTAANVDLIKSLDVRYFEDLRGSIIDTVSEGKSTRSLTDEIIERGKVSRSRAQLIAEDQINKLNGQIVEARQTSLGIEEYTWSNSGDERVRPEHRNAPVGLGNTVRRWDDPHPTEGHPGSAVRCRCAALPKL